MSCASRLQWRGFRGSLRRAFDVPRPHPFGEFDGIVLIDVSHYRIGDVRRSHSVFDRFVNSGSRADTCALRSRFIADRLFVIFDIGVQVLDKTLTHSQPQKIRFVRRRFRCKFAGGGEQFLYAALVRNTRPLA